MSQMEPGDMLREQAGSPYGRLRTDQRNSGGTGYAQNQSQRDTLYDDNFMEVLTQRIAQRTAEEVNAKFPLKESVPSAGARLALAIVSLLALIPLLIVIFTVSILHDQLWAGLIGVFIVCIAVSIINIVFNISHR